MSEPTHGPSYQELQATIAALLEEKLDNAIKILEGAKEIHALRARITELEGRVFKMRDWVDRMLDVFPKDPNLHELKQILGESR